MKFIKSIVFRLDGQLRYYNLYNIDNDKYCALEISQGQYSVLARIEFEIKNGIIINSVGMHPIIEESLLEEIKKKRLSFPRQPKDNSK